jgi:hypothetical protein
VGKTCTLVKAITAANNDTTVRGNWLMVVELPPGLDKHFGFAQANKSLTMQACIPQLAVTAFKRATKALALRPASIPI